MFVTEYYGENTKQGVFIRLHKYHNHAFRDARDDLKESLSMYEQSIQDNAEIDFVLEDNSTIVRIINPDTGHEYEAFIITDRVVIEE